MIQVLENLACCCDLPYVPLVRCESALSVYQLVSGDIRFVFLQDDTYTESYISTIGVDFVSFFFLLLFLLFGSLLIGGCNVLAENSDDRT